MLVVALLPTAISTGVLTRESGAADIRRGDDPARSTDDGVWPDSDLDRKPFERAITGLRAGTLRAAAMAQWIERIRKVA